MPDSSQKKSSISQAMLYRLGKWFPPVDDKTPLNAEQKILLQGFHSQFKGEHLVFFAAMNAYEKALVDSECKGFPTPALKTAADKVISMIRTEPQGETTSFSFNDFETATFPENITTSWKVFEQHYRDEFINASAKSMKTIGQQWKEIQSDNQSVDVLKKHQLLYNALKTAESGNLADIWGYMFAGKNGVKVIPSLVQKQLRGTDASDDAIQNQFLLLNASEATETLKACIKYVKSIPGIPSESQQALINQLRKAGEVEALHNAIKQHINTCEQTLSEDNPNTAKAKLMLRRVNTIADSIPNTFRGKLNPVPATVFEQAQDSLQAVAHFIGRGVRELGQLLRAGVEFFIGRPKSASLAKNIKSGGDLSDKEHEPFSTPINIITNDCHFKGELSTRERKLAELSSSEGWPKSSKDMVTGFKNRVNSADSLDEIAKPYGISPSDPEPTNENEPNSPRPD